MLTKLHNFILFTLVVLGALFLRELVLEATRIPKPIPDIPYQKFDWELLNFEIVLEDSASMSPVKDTFVVERVYPIYVEDVDGTLISIEKYYERKIVK